MDAFISQLRPALFAAALCLAACSSNAPQQQQNAAAGQAPDGTVEMREFQIAFIGSGDAGSGTLNFRGRAYPIKVAGLGVGGIGASSIEATGEVYDLKDVSQFPGAYGRARYGAVAGNASTGEMWLENGSGVKMHLRAKRTGLMLSLGGDALVVSLK